MKKKKQILLLIVALAWIAKPDSCEVCIHLSYYGCQVCYSNCSSVVNFISCNHTYCSQYSYDGETSSCSSYTTVQLKQNSCFSTCCGQATQSATFSISQLQKCESHNKKLTGIVGGVVGSIFGIIILIIVICICRTGNCTCNCCPSGCVNCLRGFCQGLYFLITCCQCCKCLRRHSSQPMNQGEIRQDSATNLVNLKMHSWKSEKVQNQALQNENNCAICLSGQVNAIIQCNHAFHLDCFLEWNKRNANCPLCKNQKINPVKFYCRGCRQQFVVINLQKDSDIYEVTKNIGGPNCPNCR